MRFSLSVAAAALVAMPASAVAPLPDVDLAKTLMSLNAAALCPPEVLKNWSCTRCEAGLFPGAATDIDLTTAVHGNVLAFVGTWHAARSVVLSIRGSKTPLNYVWDVEAWQDQYIAANGTVWPAARVHHGFHYIYNAVVAWADAALGKAFTAPETRGYSLLLTGHSAGASAAALFTARYTANAVGRIPTPAKLYTFGEPRTGNPAFAKVIEALARQRGTEVWRFVNKHDLVPHLPPELDVVNTTFYRHIATEVWIIPQNGTAHVCDGSGEDPHCSDSVPATQWSVTDHTSYFGLNANPCSH